jgi:hypothetical protein
VSRRPRPRTQGLGPKFVVGSDEEILARQRALDREAAAEARRAQGRLSDAAIAAIKGYLGRKPNASSTEIAIELRKKYPTAVSRLKRGKPVLDKNGKPVPMTVEHLARKITRYRRQK